MYWSWDPMDVLMRILISPRRMMLLSSTIIHVIFTFLLLVQQHNGMSSIKIGTENWNNSEQCQPLFLAGICRKFTTQTWIFITTSQLPFTCNRIVRRMTQMCTNNSVFLNFSSVSIHKRTAFLKGKAIPLQTWTSPEVSQEVEAPRFQDNRHLKVVRLSATRTGCLYQPGNIHDTHLC